MAARKPLAVTVPPPVMITVAPNQMSFGAGTSPLNGPQNSLAITKWGIAQIFGLRCFVATLSKRMIRLYLQEACRD